MYKRLHVKDPLCS